MQTTDDVEPAGPASVRRCGDRGLLMELPRPDRVLDLSAALTSDPLRGVVDHVPAACTVLVLVDGSRDIAGVASELLELARTTPPRPSTPEEQVVARPRCCDPA